MLGSTTRRFVVLAGAALVALGLVAGAANTAAAAEKIRIGLLPLTSHAPSIIADAKGYFKDQGFDVDFVTFQAAEPMAVAIASGDIDFGMTAITGGLISLADKGAVKIIGGALQEKPGIEGQKILASKKAYDAGLKTPADLKGHSFGVTTAGSSFDYMVSKVAEKEGIARDTIRIVPLQKVPAVIAALRSGQIDSWSIVPNIADPLAKSGGAVEIGKIADFIPHYQVTIVFTSSSNVTKHPDRVKRFLAALSKGIADYDAALVTKTMSPQETADIVKAIHKYVYANMPLDKAVPRIRAGAMWINQGAALNLASVKDQLDWFKAQRLVPPTSTMDKLVDTEFVKTVQ